MKYRVIQITVHKITGLIFIDLLFFTVLAGNLTSYLYTCYT